MAGLLVSVRDAEEARLALAAGVDLIDVKEPQHGSLGAAGSRVVGEVAAVVAGRKPLSVALGEILDADPDAIHAAYVSGVQYAKWGLAGVARRPDWRETWQAAMARLPRGVVPVAVVYADWPSAGAPPPPDVLKAAVQFGCGAVLIDTFDKGRGPLVDMWPPAEIRQFTAQIQAAGLLAVVAGSLSPENIPVILDCAPDYVAVRGAACSDGGREGHIDPLRLAGLMALVRGNASQPHAAQLGPGV